MLTNARKSSAASVAFCTLGAACLLFARPTYAQGRGYHVGENPSAPAAPSTRPALSTHRLARVEYVNGNVTWRTNDSAKWSKVSKNHSISEGTELWAEEGGHVEVRFDDGSLFRLGGNGVATLQTAYVDAQGEYTRIKVLSGVVTLIARDQGSVFQLDSPRLSVKTVGPSRVRVGAGDDAEVAVHRGTANLEGPLGKLTLKEGEFISERAGDKAYTVSALPAPDSWERWNEDRDHTLAGDSRPQYRDSSPRSYSSVFLSLGFPIFSGYGYGGYGYHHGYGGHDNDEHDHGGYRRR